MRFSELFGPQMPTRKRKSGGTIPEVFIVESLGLADERKDRREGEVLAAVLRMCGKIAEVLRPLAVLFNEPVHFSRLNRRGKWADAVIGR